MLIYVSQIYIKVQLIHLNINDIYDIEHVDIFSYIFFKKNDLKQK